MDGRLRQHLAPVRLRLRLQSAIHVLGLGALVGSVVALLFGMARRFLHAELELDAAAAMFLMFTATGTLIGLLKNRTWNEAAKAVDQHYQLQDRIVSALQFSGQSDASVFHALQLQDANERLQQVTPTAVVPWVGPFKWRWTVLLLLMASRWLMAPVIVPQPEHAVALTGQQLESVVQEITAEIDRLESFAHDTAAAELQELVSQLRNDVRRLGMADNGTRESLQTVSEMQQKMRALMSEMNVAAMDSQLQKVAEALAAATPFKPAANALQKQDLPKAASELGKVSAEDLSPDKLDQAQLDPTTEKLAEASQAAKDQGMEDLSETLDELAEAMKSGDSEKASQQTQELADAVKRHSLNKQLSKLLDKSSDQLGQSKQHLAAQSQSEGDGAMSGSGQNLAKGKSNKTSHSSSQKAGAKSAGNIDGPKTQLESQRQMAQLSGQLGDDGDVETETQVSGSPDSQQTAQRQAQQTFAEYQKMSEAVLDAEAIPMGHRQTIRRYFESIRPSAGTVAE